MKRLFLLTGAILSLISKLLQFYSSSGWGDLLILPAASFFTLSVLLYNKTYTRWLSIPTRHSSAVALAAVCCLSVLMFQLLTMVLFGRGKLWGVAFALPLLLCLAGAYRLYNSLKASEEI